mmetsp:Transcript_54839/g.61296  ORF Transcript_54839/g.61296 Transcript_54839/m.61296 type:complete len:298 (-) Transcript_54839:322-1215(-)
MEHSTPLHAVTAARLKNEDFVPVGGPIDPGQGFYERTLPESIYSAVFMIPLSISNMQLFSGGGLIEFVIPLFGAYVACIITQRVVVYYVIGRVVENSDQGCSSSEVDWPIRIICLAVFLATVLIEIIECVTMVLWMNMIPVWQESDKAIYKHACNNSGLTNLSHQLYTCEEEYGKQTLAKPAHGITNRYRYCMYLTMLPKVVMLCAMFWYGSGHVLLSSDTRTTILSTLSGIFAFAIDDYIYQVSVPALKKFWMKKSSTFQIHEEEVTIFENVGQFYVAAVFLTMSAAGMQYQWCGW